MISKDIEQIISTLKAKPNSLHRNKAVSHADDLLAHVKLLELVESAQDHANGRTEPYNASKPSHFDEHGNHRIGLPGEKAIKHGGVITFQAAGCACSPGTRNVYCPVHGNR